MKALLIVSLAFASLQASQKPAEKPVEQLTCQEAITELKSKSAMRFIKWPGPAWDKRLQDLRVFIMKSCSKDFARAAEQQ